MAETQQKRPREIEPEEEEPFSCEMEITKRHKNSYNQILSILDDNTEDEQQEITQDLTDFFTALQQELSSSSVEPSPELAGKPNQTVKQETGDGDGDEDKERVIRHLLEASDDELGIPNRVADGDGDGDGGGEDDIIAGEEGGFPVALCDDGLWDLEDEAANYYTLLHSQLIM